MATAKTSSKTKPASKPKAVKSKAKDVATEAPAEPIAPVYRTVLAHMGIEPYQQKVDEDYMNPAQSAHFRRILDLWKQQLLEGANKMVHQMQDDVPRAPDANDQASIEEMFNLELKARDRERKLIKKIEEAKVRVEKGEYGYCESCGIEIGIRRLEARPTATLCIDCKTLEEIKEKQHGG